ncbi:hypothetical protein BB560_006778 [Smittium megazygosporum]|uniref:C2H2-type domain-containing protein n=1 Tax=Smittium megazygosporum TaxID=133381 RepID=A0A2T9Y1N7_9FUNG|nr:hypothetical protein BB560_006778 [Smittium megazygosporum]
MGRLRRSRVHKGIKDVSKKYRLRRRTKDLDQIHNDLGTENQETPQLPLDEDLPGLGQFYCTECSKYYTDQNSLDSHKVSKVHKRRLGQLQEYAEAMAQDASIQNGMDEEGLSGSSKSSLLALTRKNNSKNKA